MNDMHRHTTVNDADKVKGLLDGTVEPSELEEDPELYSLAERIYGREALDEMGIAAPVVPTASFEDPDYVNGNNLEVELPDEPEITETVVMPDKRSSRFPFLVGLLGLAIVSFNLLVGIGSIIDLCEDPPKELPLEFNTQSNQQGDVLHVTWTATNLEETAQYSVEWTISENGSHTIVDSNWFNWSSQSTYIHSESRTIQQSPWCYISTLYENQTAIDSSNACEDEMTIETMSTIEDSSNCEENPRLVWSRIAEYEELGSWAPSGSGDLLDGALLMLFGIFSITGLRRKSG
tara:strand:+ start:9849 stop:10721 length:873 start_codon:yes stop_codon:yes gene_type:complete